MDDAKKKIARRILAFKVELHELLAKHDLDMSVDDDGTLVVDRQGGYQEYIHEMPGLLQLKRRRP